MPTALAITFTISALLHGKASNRRLTDAPMRSIAAVRRAHVAAVVMAALDRTFVSEVYDRISPSVALIMPRGVRNTSAQGSGFVVAVNGTRYILTSAHVAAGGMTVEVAFPADGFTKRHNASVVGRAPGGEDLALLALNDAKVVESLAPLDFGDSGSLRPGCFVIALGHPSGIRGAVTLGVLSGRMELPSFGSATGSAEQDGGENDDDAAAAGTKKTPFLVTDAALAGGMSGGPLCGDDGRVYGVNTLVDGRLRGLGNLAISSDRAREVVLAIAAQKEVESQSRAIRLLLFNDRFNSRARVLGVLQEAGLSEEEANAAMMGAHTSGRGVVRVFGRAADGTPLTDETLEAAEKLRADLAARDLLVELERVY